MRKIIVAGNWKMNKLLNDATSLYNAIVDGAVSASRLDRVLIFPPYPFIYPLKLQIGKEFIHLGSQNIASEASGAYTGEVSASMIKSMGVNYTLVGHSERRTYFGDSNDILRKKVDLALLEGLIPIFCCGESLAERRAEIQEKIIEEQLKASLFHLEAKLMQGVIIAYEPVWAIGTGETATTEQAEQMHAFIRKLVLEKYGSEMAENTSILYGGSCNAGNAKELFSCENVDGGLIGGASLKADEFLKIISLLDE
jgi:triosephosphate isomerase